jgi:DNA-binding transcriptional MerR regulator
MSLKLQQLDLFGNPIQEVSGVKEKKKAKTKAIPEPVSIVETPVPAAPTAVVSIPTPAIEETVVEEPIYIERPRQPRITIEKIAGKRGRKSYSEIDTEVDLIEIPDEKVLSQKLYYTISEVASWFKVNTSLLRYWENEFDILKPRKTRKGDRLFRVEDIKNLQIIYFLLRQKKYSIEGARTYLKQNKSQADTQAQLVQTLTKFKTFLLELKTGLH